MIKSILFLLIAYLTFEGNISQAQNSTLRLLSYNIRNGKGMDNKVDYDRTATVLKNSKADIIALQELDSVTKRNGGENTIQVLADKTGLFQVYGSAIPYQGGKYGVGILSKQKPLKYYTVPLPGREEERVLLIAEFTKYVIFCTHLSLTAEDRIASIAIINEQAEKFRKPIYLLGDLNAEPASKAITSLKQKWKMLSGEEPTFPATLPKKCIDFIFTYKSKKAKVRSSEVLNEPVTSDHRPVLVEVVRK
jgi:endonuclease/exonuclease/phosphatase family metal-dependent hydrolase